MIKPPDFDPQKRYPVLFYVYGEPWGQTVLDGGAVATVSGIDAGAAGLHRGERRQPRHAGAAGPRVAQDRLSQDGELSIRLIRQGGARDREVAVCRSVAHRHLGLERRRLIDAERDVPLSGRVQGRDVGRAGAGSSLLRHDLPGALRRLPQDHPDEWKQSSPITFAEQLKGNLLLDSRHRRRQRPLPGHRGADQCADCGEQAVFDDVVSESFALDCGRDRARRSTCWRR